MTDRRWKLRVASMSGSVGVSLALGSACTGDAFLGSEYIPAGLAPAIMDAGMAPAETLENADAAATTASASAPDAMVGIPTLAVQAHEDGTAIAELRIVCPNRCAMIELAAEGGTPPYAYTWEDGASTVTRTLCPTSEAPILASVRDALGETTMIQLAVHLDACKVEALCVANPSFEGSPTLGAEWLSSESLSANAWSDCRSTSGARVRSLPRAVNAASGDEFPTPTDGSTCLYLPTHENTHGYVGQELCAPLERGSVYYLKLDAAYAAEDSAGAPLDPGQLEIYSADDACSRSELLWASPPLHTAFRTYCVALQPSTSRGGLVFSPTGVPAKDSAVFIDHLESVTSCP